MATFTRQKDSSLSSSWLRAADLELILLAGMFAVVHLALYGDTLTPLLLHQEVLGLPRMSSVLKHEDGPVVVDGVPGREAIVSVRYRS